MYLLQNRLIDFENEIMRGEGIGSLGRTCTHCYILNGLTTRTCYIAHGTLLSVMWQPGWERSLGENLVVAKSFPILCSPMDCCTAGFLVLHYPLEFAQIHVH